MASWSRKCGGQNGQKSSQTQNAIAFRCPHFWRSSLHKGERLLEQVWRGPRLRPAHSAVLPMTTALALVAEVEEAIARGTSRQRCEILRRVTDMFVLGSHRYSDEEIDLLDDVFSRLAAEIEASARSLLAMRLAPIPNAPPRIIRTLAIDDAADVACPILIQSERLADSTLVEVAREKGQEHLFAISRRSTLSEAVTDILVDRGDQLVVLSIAENRGAVLSDFGFSVLVKRAEGEDRLAASVGARPEIPPHLFAKLLAKASRAVRAKLEAAHPNALGEVQRTIAEVADRLHVEKIEASPSYATAKALIEPLHRSGRLDDQLAVFANAGRLEEVVAGLALRCQLSLQTIERAILQERSDKVLILGRAIELSWPTVKAILLLRVAQGIMPAAEMTKARAVFERLEIATAQEVVQFYRKSEVMGGHSDHAH